MHGISVCVKEINNEIDSKEMYSLEEMVDLIESAAYETKILDYEVDENTKSIIIKKIKTYPTQRTLIIPGSIEGYDGYSVIFRPDEVIKHGKLKTIIFDEGVVKICSHSFDDCKLVESLKLPDSLIEIQNSALTDFSNMYELHIPKNVVSLGKTRTTKQTDGTFVESIVDGNPFAGTERLVKIVVEDENPYYSHRGNCLIEEETGRMILGTNNSSIPMDNTIKSI
jgi:hypothetical protein